MEENPFIGKQTHILWNIVNKWFRKNTLGYLTGNQTANILEQMIDMLTF